MKFVLLILLLLILSIMFLIFINKKNKIAIVSSIFNHLECLGFLLEYLNTYTIDIYINEDKYNHIDYYKKKFKFNIYNINDFNEHEYDKIIKLTSWDPYTINKKHISILHLVGTENPDKPENTKFITLSPFVKPKDFKYSYILTVYNDYIDEIKLNKNIGYIGMFVDEYENNIIKFIDTINGKLICLGCNNIKTENNINKGDNIINYDNINTIEMIDKLKKCSYIYIKQHNDRYTGAITIALSLNIPLIIKKTLADLYDIPAITYDKNITELNDSIKNMDMETYKKIKYNLRMFTDNTINKNKQTIKIMYG